MIYYAALGIGVLLTACAQLLIKIGANKYGGNGFLSTYLNFPTILAFFLFFITTVLNTFAYRTVPLKASVAVLPANFVAVGILSFLVLKERLTKKQLVGVIIILTGIMLYALV